MKNKASKLMMIAICSVLVGCGNSNFFTTSGSPYSLLNGRTAKKKYETIASVGIGELNYMKTSAAQNAEHFANFVDGLLTHNDFGTLELIKQGANLTCDNSKGSSLITDMVKAAKTSGAHVKFINCTRLSSFDINNLKKLGGDNVKFA